ncbi:uncharacterized protein N7500_002948 [Penicillium coprophilum]|uniref:uncharacterized protein n=1 Tax=Penicillium coprophilum TaxID=36646 RepID=UPI0023A06143|nr:uncharacterized protein N7500_002948 [Penicillium coprophilum]KAJ5170165.1 hypothetical protein N7500_002948 [Penicillium coprophilum]
MPSTWLLCPFLEDCPVSPAISGTEIRGVIVLSIVFVLKGFEFRELALEVKEVAGRQSIETFEDESAVVSITGDEVREGWKALDVPYLDAVFLGVFTHSGWTKTLPDSPPRNIEGRILRRRLKKPSRGSNSLKRGKEGGAILAEAEQG